MTAAEARTQSVINAAQIKADEAIEAARQAESTRMAKAEAAVAWHHKQSEEIALLIQHGINYGRNTISVTIKSRNDVCSPYNFDYARELDSIVSYFIGMGYTVRIDDKYVIHDESAAYLNSGGECGSDKPYSTYDTILSVSW